MVSPLLTRRLLIAATAGGAVACAVTVTKYVRASRSGSAPTGGIGSWWRGATPQPPVARCKPQAVSAESSADFAEALAVVVGAMRRHAAADAERRGTPSPAGASAPPALFEIPAAAYGALTSDEGSAAVAALERAVAADARNADAWALLGLLRLRGPEPVSHPECQTAGFGGPAGRAMAAQQCFVSTIEADASHSAAWQQLGNTIRIISADRSEAAPDAPPMPATATVTVGGKAHRVANPWECYRRAVEGDATNAAAWSNLAAAYPGDDDDSLAAPVAVTVGGVAVTRRDCALRAVELNPSSSAAWLALGNMAEGGDAGDVRVRGKVVSQLQCFERAVGLDPRSSVAWNNLGTALMPPREAMPCVMGKGALAAEGEEEARPAPQLPTKTATLNGNTVTAKECFMQAMMLDPGNRLAALNCQQVLVAEAYDARAKIAAEEEAAAASN